MKLVSSTCSNRTACWIVSARTVSLSGRSFLKLGLRLGEHDRACIRRAGRRERLADQDLEQLLVANTLERNFRAVVGDLQDQVLLPSEREQLHRSGVRPIRCCNST